MDTGGNLALGMKALAQGWISSVQLQEILVEQARGASRGSDSAQSLELLLLSRGYLTADQLSKLAEVAPPSGPAPSVPASAVQPRRADGPGIQRTDPTGRFGKFELRRLLGRGSMGLVFEAFDTAQGRAVALKRPFSRSTGQTPNRLEEQRFFTEAGLATLIPRHPNIVEVYEAGRIEGQCYLAMELVEGRPMSEWRKTATLPQELDILKETARAVHHAHEHSVIHRDLKPSNIMIRPSGRSVVMDFGVAKCAGPGHQGASLTPVGFTIGTPGYMSPEQAQGRKHIDRTTDVYSLGVMLYEALTGRKPFEGRSAMDVLLRMMNEPIRRPSTQMRAGLNPVLLQTLEAVCLKALAREPWNRYPTAKDFADALEPLARTESRGAAGLSTPAPLVVQLAQSA